MSVKIRFTRLGKPKTPFYRIVVMDSRKRRDGEYLDKVGHFNPLVNKEDRTHQTFHLDRDKIMAWLNKGAQPTQIVLDLLKEENIWEDFTKQKSNQKKKNKRKSNSTPISEMLKRKEEKKRLDVKKKKALENKEKKIEQADKSSKAADSKPSETDEKKPEQASDNQPVDTGVKKEEQQVDLQPVETEKKTVEESTDTHPVNSNKPEKVIAEVSEKANSEESS